MSKPFFKDAFSIAPCGTLLFKLESEPGNTNKNSKTVRVILLFCIWLWINTQDNFITAKRMYAIRMYMKISKCLPFFLIFSVSEFGCHITGCCAALNTLEEYEHHYNSLHRHVCCSCRRSFPSARLLDIHIQEWHDSLFTLLAEKQDMVRLCGNVFHALHLSVSTGNKSKINTLSVLTRKLALKYKKITYKCLTIILSPWQYQCFVEGCGQKFKTSEYRKDHLISVHKYPADFRFEKRKKDRG